MQKRQRPINSEALPSRWFHHRITKMSEYFKHHIVDAIVLGKFDRYKRKSAFWWTSFETYLDW